MRRWKSQQEYDEAVAKAKALLGAPTITMTPEQLAAIYKLAPESRDGTGGCLESHVAQVLFFDDWYLA